MLPNGYVQQNGVMVPESQAHGSNGVNRVSGRFGMVGTKPDGPGGRTVFEPFESFVGRQNSTSQAYLNPSIARRFDFNLQQAMLLDPVCMEPLHARIAPVAMMEGEVKPENEDDADEKAAAKVVDKIVKSIPSFTKMRWALLMASWFGRYGVQLRYRWDKDPHKTYGERLEEMKEGVPDRLLCPFAWSPIHGDKIAFNQYTGGDGVFVRASSSASNSRNTTYGNEAMVRWIDKDERDQFIIHRHEILDADYFSPEMAGMISGWGLREYCWWPWWFKQNALTWIMMWVERLGTGFTIWFFEQDNVESERHVRQAAEAQRSNTQILFPRGRDGTRGPGIERIEASTGGADFLLKVLTDYFGDQIKRMIVGQTLSSQTGATGLGSNVAEQHGNTRDLICRFDAKNLDETLTTRLVRPIQRWCFPKLKGRMRYESVLEKQDPDKMMNAAEKLFNWGADLPEDHMREVVGIPAPKKGEKTLSKAKSQPQGQPGAPGGMDAGPGGADAAQGEGGDDAAFVESLLGGGEQAAEPEGAMD